jgi:excinuclease ABC subunit C
MADAERLAKGRGGYETGAAVLRAHLITMPETPGVYRMLAVDGAVLYVGKAKNLKRRVTSYTQRARLPVRLQRMVAQVRGVEIVVTRTEAEALLLEANFIQRFDPPFNVLLRDDKSYPFLLIARDHAFPPLVKHRGARGRAGDYFGPFASAAAMAATYEQLQRGFMLRTCSDTVFKGRSRPCLQYHIKRCTAPCVGRVAAAAYAAQVAEAEAFLRGQSSAVQKELARAMQAASDALDYETAALFRDRIKSLTRVQEKQDVFVEGLGDVDVIALAQQGGSFAVQVFFYRADRNYGARVFFPTQGQGADRADVLAAFLAQFYVDKVPPPQILLNEEPADRSLLDEALGRLAGRRVQVTVPRTGEKKRLVVAAAENAAVALARKLADRDEQKRLLRRVAEVFALARVPARIEVYDNSHLAGQFAVGGMIAAGEAGLLPKTYRKFTIKSAAGDDDFGMMREVLTRRFARLLTEDPERRSGLWPDLLLIDGGAGQIGRVDGVLRELGVTDVALVGIAKGPDRNAGRERFFRVGAPPLSLPADDPVLYYLQRLRDEAHRFAIGTHRARRAKAISASGLDDVPGIGPVRKRALLHHFGSAKAVKEAAVEDLARADGVNQAMAQRLFAFFHAAVKGHDSNGEER